MWPWRERAILSRAAAAPPGAAPGAGVLSSCGRAILAREDVAPPLVAPGTGGRGPDAATYSGHAHL
jgi:hypothetical protein